MYTEAQKRATSKYNAKTYDRLELQVKKGKKEKYREYAKSQGYSVNEFFIKLMETEMESPRLQKKEAED